MPKKRLTLLTKNELELCLKRRDVITARVIKFNTVPNTVLSELVSFEAELLTPSVLAGSYARISGIFDNAIITTGCTIRAQVATINSFAGGQIGTMAGIIADYGDEAYIRLISQLGTVKKNISEKIFCDKPYGTNLLDYLSQLDPKSDAQRYNITEEQVCNLKNASCQYTLYIKLVEEFCHKLGLGILSENTNSTSSVLTQLKNVAETALTKTKTPIGYEYLMNTIWSKHHRGNPPKKDHLTANDYQTIFTERMNIDPDYKLLIDLLRKRPYLLCNGKGTISTAIVDALVKNRDEYAFDVYDPDRIRALVIETQHALSEERISPADAQAYLKLTPDANFNQALAKHLTDFLTKQSKGVYTQSNALINLTAAKLEADETATGRLFNDKQNLMLTQALQSLIAMGNITCEAPNAVDTNDAGFRVYTEANFMHQTTIQRYFNKALNQSHQSKTVPNRSRVTNGCDDDQWRAVENAFECPVSLLTGGPGRGKSFTLALITKAWTIAHPTDKILLLSPTNKAKKKLQNDLSKEALNYKDTFSHTRTERIITVTAAKFIYVKSEYRTPIEPNSLVIIDESSMISTETLADVLSILEECRCYHLVMAGDTNQLGPIETGNPFLELIESNKIPIANLTINYRQDDAELIGCFDAISEGNMRDVLKHANATKNIDLRLNNTKQNLHYAEQAVELYLQSTQATSTSPNFDDTLLVTPFTNETERNYCGRNATCAPNLSATIQNHIMPVSLADTEPFVTAPHAIETAGYGFIDKRGWCIHTTKQPATDTNGRRVGSRLVVTSTIVSTSDPEYRLTNGDIITVDGILKIYNSWSLHQTQTGCPYVNIFGHKLRFELKDPNENEYYAIVTTKEAIPTTHIITYQQLMQSTELGYALTTHKAQGSEYKNVIVVLPATGNEFDDNPFVNRNLIYTALTRAKKTLTVIGSYNIFMNAIEHPANPRLDDLSHKI